jgi:hypothetical protein
VNVTQTLFKAEYHFIGSFKALPTCIDVFASSSVLGVNHQFIAVDRSMTACVVPLKTSHLIFVNVKSILVAEATTSLSSPFIFQSSSFIFCNSAQVNHTAPHVDLMTAFICATCLCACTASSITHLKKFATHREARAVPACIKAFLIPLQS